MPVLGEATFAEAVQKVMRESDVSKKSAEKIVGAAESKKTGNIHRSKGLDMKRKPKKRNLHSILSTPLEGKSKILKLKANAYRLKFGVLSVQDEVLLTRLLKTLENDKIADKRDELTDKLVLRQDVADRQEDNPNSDVLKQELESKDMDVTFMVEDILNTDKKVRGGIPMTPTFIGKLTAKMVTAFEESEHPRAEGGEFTKGSGSSGSKKDKSEPKSDIMANEQEVRSIIQNSSQDFLTRFEIADQTGIGGADVQDVLDSLVENGRLEQRTSEPTEEEMDDPDFDEDDFIGETEYRWIEGRSSESRKKPKKNKSDRDPTGKLSTKGLKPGQNLKDSQVTNVLNHMMREIDPDEQGDLSGFSDSLVKSTAERFQISEKDTLEIFESNGTPDKPIKFLGGKTGKIYKGKSDLKFRIGKNNTFKFQIGKLRTGSLVDDFRTANDDRYVSYFLLNADVNLKEWGVTALSLPQHIGTFKNMPFVITKTKFFEASAYGEETDHPSTEHFARLGITRSPEKNDMMQQAAFQEEFRVGNIEEIINTKDGDYLAFIKIKPEFANYEMPPLVSPAIFQLNPMEPPNRITQWVGMHLAGLDEAPAYGNSAVFKGSCNGDKNTCLTQLSAKMPQLNVYLPPCAMKKIFNARLKVVMMKIAAMQSSDHPQIRIQNIHKKKKKMAGGEGSGPQKGQKNKTMSEKRDERIKKFQEKHPRLKKNTKVMNEDKKFFHQRPTAERRERNKKFLKENPLPTAN